MKNLPFTLLAAGALALVVGAAAPLAGQAQQSSRTARTASIAAVEPTPRPMAVSAGNEEANEPSPPVDAAAGTPETTETEILANDGATFASKDRIAVFTGDVRVTDPRFQLSCDKLTVFLAKAAATDTAKPKGAPSPEPRAKGAAPVPAPTPGSTGGIDHAIAEGHVIIVQERAATQGGEAKRSVGRGDWAYFDNKSGDMVLKGMPSVEQNENTHTATSPNTVMTLRKDNSLMTVGPSRTIIVQRKSSELPGSQNSPPARGQNNAARHEAAPSGHRQHATPTPAGDRS